MPKFLRRSSDPAFKGMRWPEAGNGCARRDREELLLYFFFRFAEAAFLIFLLIRELLLFFLFILGDNGELDRVDLRHFKLDIAFRAAQNFALFDLILV
jgi:hypothetical protein